MGANGALPPNNVIGSKIKNNFLLSNVANLVGSPIEWKYFLDYVDCLTMKTN